jgi:hypothetical protein
VTEPRNAASQATLGAGGAVRLDTSQLKTRFRNVLASTRTREEAVLNLGVDQTWDQGARKCVGDLHDRITLSPAAAKLMHTLSGDLLRQHEARFGNH